MRNRIEHFKAMVFLHDFVNKYAEKKTSIWFSDLYTNYIKECTKNQEIILSHLSLGKVCSKFERKRTLNTKIGKFDSFITFE